MKNALLKLSLLLLMILSSIALASKVDFYTNEVPIHSQSNEEKQKAIPIGLANVFVKVSGNEQILQNPRIKQHLRHASQFVQQMGYIASSDKTNPYLLQIHFDVNAVNQCLRDATALATLQTLPIKILGIDKQSDFTHLIRYLNGLTPVASVNIINVNGTTILLNLSLRNTEESFLQAVALEHKLSVIQQDQTSLMTLQWNH